MIIENRKENSTPLVERAGPAIFRFENPGDYIRGRLINIDTADIGGKPTLKYVLQDEADNRIVSFLGTVDLNTKIRRSDVGKMLEIRYERKDRHADEGKNAIKRFKVLAEDK